MFYYSKWLFFVIFYGVSAGLYYLIDKQVILKGLMENFFLGAAAVFGIITFASFMAAFIIFVLLKYCYITACAVCKIEKKITHKTFWAIFTALCFIFAFIVFWKATQY